jgi:hypothetical protein
MATKLLNGRTIVGGAGEEIASIRAPIRAFPRMVHIVITGGTATVKLKGRNDPSMPWTDVAQYTATGFDPIYLPAQVTAEIVAIDGATVTLSVDDV